MKLHKHEYFTGIEPKTMDHTPLSYCVLFLVEHNSGKKNVNTWPHTRVDTDIFSAMLLAVSSRDFFFQWDY